MPPQPQVNRCVLACVCVCTYGVYVSEDGSHGACLTSVPSDPVPRPLYSPHNHIVLSLGGGLRRAMETLRRVSSLAG